MSTVALSAAPDAGQLTAYYRAALWGLRRLDEVGVPPARFDAAADARWAQFQGHLTWSHRVDLLLRDAAVRFGAAFHAGAVFELPGLAGDEPFGPDWTSLRAQDARDRWEEVKRAAGGNPAIYVERWSELLKIPAPKGPELERPGPAEHLLACGPTAAWRVHRVFQGQGALDWSKNVTVIAETPAARQFVGLLAVVDPAPGATKLVRGPGSGDDAAAWTQELRSELPRLDRIVLDPQAAPAVAQGVEALRALFPRAVVVGAE